MTVSVVIPCYNHGRFLAAAIDSALAQTRPCELIVVNDGSTDDSPAIARRYARVRLIDQPNRGLSAARNAGLAASTGDVVIFLDADDRLRPGAADAAVRELSVRHDAAMVFGRCVLIDAEGAALPTPRASVRGNLYAALLQRNHIWMPAMAAYRRAALAEAGGFDPVVSPSADYDMYLRLARTAVIVGHDEVVAEYRQHGANMSGDPVRMLTNTLVVLRRQRAHVAADPVLSGAYRAGLVAWREFYGERLVERFRTRLHAGDSRRALADAWRLLRLYPSGVRRHVTKTVAIRLGRLGHARRGNRLRHPASF